MYMIVITFKNNIVNSQYISSASPGPPRAEPSFLRSLGACIITEVIIPNFDHLIASIRCCENRLVCKL